MLIKWQNNILLYFDYYLGLEMDFISGALKERSKWMNWLKTVIIILCGLISSEVA